MMNLSPTEMERLTIFTAAELARRYRSQGIRLSQPEAIALIADEVMTAARKGLSLQELVTLGHELLGPEDVLPGVGAMTPLISVEVSLPEGTKLVTLFSPIDPGPEGEVVPGELIAADGEIEINAGRERVTLEVVNSGDRTIQVRSHAHFFEANPALVFEREKAFGYRLDMPSGTGIRFDPGIAKQVPLVAFAGSGKVFGFGGLTDGDVADPAVRKAALERARALGYSGA
ncbi:MAG: urease subunit beta [Rhodospirillales bacterium]